MIVATKAILMAHTSVDKTLSFELIKPYLADAEENYLVPILGDEFYQALSAWPTEGTPLQKQILELAQRTAANFGLCLYLPTGNIQISDAGAQISSTKEKKMAFEWQINKAINSISRLAMNALEQLINLLEKNVDVEVLELYKDASIRTLNNSFFIRTAQEFNDRYHIDRNRLTFICLQTVMRQVEQDLVVPMIGQEFADELKTKRNANTLTPEEKRKFDMICKTIAFYTIKDVLPQLAVEISPLGLSANYFSMINNVEYKTPAADTRVTMLLSYVEEKCTFYSQQLPALLPGYEVGGPMSVNPEGLKIFPLF